jgi:hypothetical protein
MTQPPTLAERLLLLSIPAEPVKRRRTPLSTQPGDLDFTLQAALLVELIGRGHVAVAPGRGALAGETIALQQHDLATGNTPLDALLARIAEGKNAEKTLQNWLIGSSAARLIRGDLVERGIVTEHYDTFGPFVRNYRVVPVDPVAHAGIRDEFEDVFLRDREPAQRDYATAALLLSGAAWEHVEPAEGTPGMAHFFERLRELSDRYRPEPSAGQDARDVTRVLAALARVNASTGGH